MAMRLETKKIFLDFAKNTSLHGIRYIALSRTSFIERIFWILILISSLSFAGYLTTLFWRRHTSNPTRTVLKNAFAPTTTVPFPAVTICNINKIVESEVDIFLTKLEASEGNLLTTKNVFSHLSLEEDTYYNVTELNIAQNVLDQNDYSDMRRIMKRVSQRCENLIIRCAWNEKQVSCKDIFEESFSGDGRCCSFNYVRDKAAKPALYNLYYGLSTGLRVVLNPKDNNNFAGVILLPVSHRQCLYSDERKLQYFSRYTDSNCMSVCEAMSIYKTCGCVPYFFDFVDDKPICDVRKLPCLQNIKNISTESCDCLSQCEDELYDVGMTSSKFIYNPNVWMMDFLKGINNTENSILLNIFFSTNRQTIWLRDTMTSGIYLISSFGGIYSLFLGCSIITLIEILYHIMAKYILIALCGKQNSLKDKKQFNNKYDVYTVSQEMKKQSKHNNSDPIMPFIN